MKRALVKEMPDLLQMQSGGKWELESAETEKKEPRRGGILGRDRGISQGKRRHLKSNWG